MNEPTQTETPKPRKKRSKSTTPRQIRALDPAIEAINEEARLKRAEHRKAQGSARILRVIIEKRLPQLSLSDLQRLQREVNNLLTAPALPLAPAEKAAL